MGVERRDLWNPVYLSGSMPMNSTRKTSKDVICRWAHSGDLVGERETATLWLVTTSPGCQQCGIASVISPCQQGISGPAQPGHPCGGFPLSLLPEVGGEAANSGYQRTLIFPQRTTYCQFSHSDSQMGKSLIQAEGLKLSQYWLLTTVWVVFCSFQWLRGRGQIMFINGCVLSSFSIGISIFISFLVLNF